MRFNFYKNIIQTTRQAAAAAADARRRGLCLTNKHYQSPWSFYQSL